jgi:hypothetical protein
MARTVDSLLTELEQKKTLLGDVDSEHLKKLVARLSHARFLDSRSLARFHDLLLFLRTFPPSQSVFRQSGALLRTFSARIKKLFQADVDLSPIRMKKSSRVSPAPRSRPCSTMTKPDGLPSISWSPRD